MPGQRINGTLVHPRLLLLPLWTNACNSALISTLLTAWWIPDICGDDTENLFGSSHGNSSSTFILALGRGINFSRRYGTKDAMNFCWHAFEADLSLFFQPYHNRLLTRPCHLSGISLIIWVEDHVVAVSPYLTIELSYQPMRPSYPLIRPGVLILSVCFLCAPRFRPWCFLPSDWSDYPLNSLGLLP